MTKKEMHDQSNDLLKKFWSLDFSNEEEVSNWFEQWEGLTQVLKNWASEWREKDTPQS